VIRADFSHSGHLVPSAAVVMLLLTYSVKFLGYFCSEKNATISTLCLKKNAPTLKQYSSEL